MRSDVDLTSFTRGELSPRLKGRTDFKGYFDGCDTLLNMVVLPQGGATRRPGTTYSAMVKDQTNPPKLIPFTFSVLQSYMLEFGNLYMRVYKDRFPVTNVLTVTGAVSNGGPNLIRLTVTESDFLYTGNTATVAGVGGMPNATGTWIITVINQTTIDLQGSTFGGLYTSGGTATVIVEVPTPWLASEVQQLGYCQSNDTLFVCHPLHPVQQVTRASHTNWGCNSMAFLDGPYQSVGSEAGTLTSSGTTGAVTLTASFNAFVATDVGRLVRSFDTVWGWAIITGFISATQVTAGVQAATTNGAGGAFPAGPTGTWVMGKWSGTTGYPWLPMFWQQRLFFVGTNTEPNAIEGSMTGVYNQFSPSQASGTVGDNNALSWVINDDQVNATRWVSPAGAAQTPQFGIGTEGNEHIMQAGGAAVAVTPTSVNVYRESTLGAKAYAKALRIVRSVFFSNHLGRKLIEWSYSWQDGGYVGKDKTAPSEHITRGKIADLAYQKNPYGIIWARLDSGGLIGFTTLLEQGVEGWHRHTLGGYYYGGPPIVESIAVIPSTNDVFDELWLSVKRTLNGSVVRTIEVMENYFDDELQENAVFMDGSIQSALVTPAATVTPSAMSGSGVTLTASAGTPFASGDVGKVVRLTGGVGQITAFTSSTVVTVELFRPLTSLAPQTSGNWSMTAQSSTFSGLSYLNGETVQILGDGADMGTQVVAAGAVTIPTERGKASFATIGLPITYRLVTMPWATQQNPSAQGKVKTGVRLYLRLLDTLGCNVGRQVTDEYTSLLEDAIEPLETRNALQVVGWAPPLFTGLYPLPLPGSHDLEGQILVTGSGPYPTTVLALVATGDVGEMPGGPG